MATIQYEIDINAPVDKVFEYYTNPDNIKQAWPRYCKRIRKCIWSKK